MGKFSKEFLFRECVLHRHCILLRLCEPIRWDNDAVDEIFMVDMCLDNVEKEQMILNIANTIDSYGTIRIKAFAGNENPHDAKNITIYTANIIEIELIKNE